MNNIHILNLSAYTSPIIEESKNKDFVQYGTDNNYFQYLIDRYLYSNTNHAIITGVTNMIYGKGIFSCFESSTEVFYKNISIL